MFSDNENMIECSGIDIDVRTEMLHAELDWIADNIRSKYIGIPNNAMTREMVSLDIQSMIDNCERVYGINKYVIVSILANMLCDVFSVEVSRCGSGDFYDYSDDLTSDNNTLSLKIKCDWNVQ